MSKFIRDISVTVDYEGDKVAAALAPMDYATACKFRALSARAKKEKLEETEYNDALRDAVKTHLISLTGLKDHDGNAVGAELMLSVAYFAPLVTQLSVEWATRSMPGN